MVVSPDLSNLSFIMQNGVIFLSLSPNPCKGSDGPRVNIFKIIIE